MFRSISLKWIMMAALIFAFGGCDDGDTPGTPDGDGAASDGDIEIEMEQATDGDDETDGDEETEPDDEKPADGDDSPPECDEGPCCEDGRWIDEGEPCISDDDELDCTADTCNTEHQCSHKLIEEHCLIDGNLCAAAGDASEDDACLVCDPELSTDEWSAPDCDDEDICTEDSCDRSAGCINDAVVCDDELACTIDSCDPVEGCTFVPDDSICDDDVACTIDVCDPVEDCKNTPDDTVCDDLVGCTADSCDIVEGCINAPDDTACDDEVSCTMDTCDVIDGCINAPDDSACADEIDCTIDSCDPVSDCINEADDSACNDEVGCTADTCDPTEGCLNDPRNEACDDEIECTADSCDPLLDCQHVPDDAPCADEVECTVDICDPVEGCLNTPDHTICEDEVSCTADICDPVDGCGNNPDDSACDDEVSCTADVCDPELDCLHTPDDNACDDEISCTSDICDPIEDCIHTPDNDACDDSIACTSDSCDILAGCLHEPDDGACNDEIDCTADSCDTLAGCLHEADDSACDDEIDCTGDICDLSEGCLHNPDDSACDDQVSCTVDSCDESEGCLHVPDDSACVDDIDCTVDSCHIVEDCKHVPNDDACDDGISCTEDYCDSQDGCSIDTGNCECDDDDDCDDHDPCTSDQCSGSYNCRNRVRDDRRENNDSAAQATELGANQTLTSLRINDGDDDWFALEICEGGELTLTVQFDHDDGDINAFLLDGSETQLQAAQSENDNETISWTATYTGTAYIKITLANGGCNDYQLTAAFDDSACCTDAAEPNNNAGEAATPVEGVTTDLVACPDDEDWYVVSLEEGEVLTAAVFFTHADGDISLFLLDAAQSPISSGESATDDEWLVYTATATADVYVKVEGATVDVRNNYALSIVVNEAPCAKSTAQLVCGETLPSTTIGAADEWNGYSCEPGMPYGDPEAVFAIDAMCNGWITIDLQPNADALLVPYLLEACDASQCLTGITSQTELQIRIWSQQGERYYLAVDSDDGESNNFSIAVSCSCTLCSDEDGDGYFAYHPQNCPEGDDCSDDNDKVNPGETEIDCDGIDQDCTGGDNCNHFICTDTDNDGYYRRDPTSCPQGLDCNDDRDDIKPGATEIDCNGIDENCDGMDWCPGTQQHCDPCFFFSCKEGHQCLGYFDELLFFCVKDCTDDGLCPAGSTCMDFGGRDACWPDPAATCEENVLLLSDTCGNDLGDFNCGAGQCNAEQAICQVGCGPMEGPLTCDTTISGHTSTGTKTFRSYNCAQNESGPELIYEYTPTCDGTLLLNMQVISDADIDLLVLEDGCDNASCIAVSKTSSSFEELAVSVTNGENYYVVVDGKDFDEGRFSLEVECFCNTGQAAHCEDCEHDFDCADGICIEWEGEQIPPVRVCAADCSTDGVCPDDAQCRLQEDGRFACLPDLTGRCIDDKLYADDACSNTFLYRTCEAGSVCNASSMNCDTGCEDNDGDDYFGYDATDCPLGDDCNDTLSSIHPGADDIYCNGIDEDCSGVDNCSDAKQCEPCDGGHCSPGHVCFNWPGDSYEFCIKDCSQDYDCEIESYELTCHSYHPDPYYCLPDLIGHCEGKQYTLVDGCGHAMVDSTCEINCFEDYGCVNYCDTDNVIDSCPTVISGDTRTGENKSTYYYNDTHTIRDKTGPELSYKYTADCDGEISARIESDDDLTLIIIKDVFGHCKTYEMIDYAYADMTNVVNWIAHADHTYYLIIDGHDAAAGPFDVYLSCFCADCEDNDEDGFDGYDAVSCPIGTDCDDGNNAINPDAAEIECNRIDENCDGFDSCANASCVVDEEIVCNGDTIFGDTTGKPNQIDWYGGACDKYYPETAGENVYHLNSDCPGEGMVHAELTNVVDEYIGLYILESDCMANSCKAKGWFEAEAATSSGEDYYIVVDGYDGHTSAYDLTVTCACYNCIDSDTDGFFAYDETDCPIGDDCNDGNDAINPDAEEIECNDIDDDCDGVEICPTATCSADATITCDSGVLSGDLTGRENRMTIYSCSEWFESGGEMIYGFTASCSGLVSASLNYDTDIADLDIFVLETVCGADACLAYGDEGVTFDATQSGEYFLVVDGYGGSETTFELSIDCACR